MVTRAQAQQIALGSAKLVEALLSPESIAAKRNTEAIEVGPNAMMSARLLEYKPAAPRPFDDVKEEIRRQLARQAAVELAQKDGREKLALLEQGKTDREAGVTFAPAVALVRNRPQPGFTPDAVTRIFQADAKKLPRYIGAPSERGGFAIYKVVNVIAPPEAEPAKLATARTRISEVQNREMFDAYISALRAKAKVEINQPNLDKK
jgi:peptidyl-prolyl cis-trans isomerase D